PHWNGPTWSTATSPTTRTAQSKRLFGVTFASASDCWIVGYIYVTGNSLQTLVEHWNGAAWFIVTSPNTSTTEDNLLFGATCTSASDCWAVGYYFDSGVNVYHTLIERYT